MRAWGSSDMLSLEIALGIAALSCGLVSVVMFIMLLHLRRTQRATKERCVSRTTGTVVGPSAINYAGHHIPLVSYFVYGTEHLEVQSWFV